MNQLPLNKNELPLIREILTKYKQGYISGLIPGSNITMTPSGCRNKIISSTAEGDGGGGSNIYNTDGTIPTLENRTVTVDGNLTFWKVTNEVGMGFGTGGTTKYVSSVAMNGLKYANMSVNKDTDDNDIRTELQVGSYDNSIQHKQFVAKYDAALDESQLFVRATNPTGTEDSRVEYNTDDAFVDIKDVGTNPNPRPYIFRFRNPSSDVVFSFDSDYVKNFRLPAYADDAAAGIGGLTAGQPYQTTGTAASPLNIAGIVMIKQ